MKGNEKFIDVAGKMALLLFSLSCIYIIIEGAGSDVIALGNPFIKYGLDVFERAPIINVLTWTTLFIILVMFFVKFGKK